MIPPTSLSLECSSLQKDISALHAHLASIESQVKNREQRERQIQQLMKEQQETFHLLSSLVHKKEADFQEKASLPPQDLLEEIKAAHRSGLEEGKKTYPKFRKINNFNLIFVFITH